MNSHQEFRQIISSSHGLSNIDVDMRSLNRGLERILRRIDKLTHGHTSVLWTDNGYHIYEPMEGFIWEEEERFASLAVPAGKDLTSRFMQFAEDFLTNKKGDPQHNPTVNSCLVRIPGTINSKCGHPTSISLTAWLTCWHLSATLPNKSEPIRPRELSQTVE